MSFAELWRRAGTDRPRPRDRGYRRYSWTPADAECRAWFTRQADGLGLTVEQDRNGNLWAWWGAAREDAVVTGSHLDSVPDGGGYDGALGVASALAAVAELKARNFNPERPVAIAVFTEEEGARFRVPCLGSRLMTGAIEPGAARALSDDDGVTLAAAMTAAGCDASLLGPDEDLLARFGAFVELHVEQGRALAPLGAAIGVAEGIWPHGRWRFDFAGRADHAGTARLADRNDPMLPYASTVLAARQAAADAWRAGHVRQGHRRAGRRQRGELGRPGLAGRPRPGRRALLATLSPRSVRPPRCSAGEHGVTSHRPSGVIHSAGALRREPAGPDHRRAGAGPGSPPRCSPPAPGTTPGSSPPGSRRPCCSSATRPASRTRPPNTPRRPTAKPACTRSPWSSRTWPR